MHFSEQTEISFPAANRSTIQLLNAGTELIAAGSAVAVLFVEDTFSGVLCAVPATSDEELWGIAAEKIIPGTYGNVVLAGIVKAFIYGGSGKYAVPSVKGLTAGDSGKAQIIYCGTPETPGIVLLGGGGSGGSETEYKGQFGIRFLGNRTFEVRYGKYNYAGSTDFGEVPVQTIVFPDNIGDDVIRLYACRNDNKYSVVIQLSRLAYPQGYFDYVELGRCFATGTVYQYHTSYDRIDFGRRWFL